LALQNEILLGYIGLFISGTTFLACLVYLGYDFYRRRPQQKSEIFEGTIQNDNLSKGNFYGTWLPAKPEDNYMGLLLAMAVLFNYPMRNI